MAEVTTEQYDARTAALNAEAAGMQAQAAAQLKVAEANMALAKANQAMADAMMSPNQPPASTPRLDLLRCLEIVAAARVENEVGTLLTAARDMVAKLPA
jgi:hypothetical protein